MRILIVIYLWIDVSFCHFGISGRKWDFFLSFDANLMGCRRNLHSFSKKEKIFIYMIYHWPPVHSWFTELFSLNNQKYFCSLWVCTPASTPWPARPRVTAASPSTTWTSSWTTESGSARWPPPATTVRTPSPAQVSVRVHGYIGIWVHEYMGIWVHEFMSIAAYEYMSAWILEYMRTWEHMYTVHDYFTS